MKTIAWDVDDVLNNLMKNWLEFYLRSSQNEKKISYNDLIENPPHNVLGVRKKDYLDLLDSFRLSDLAWNLEPNEYILSWFRDKGHLYRHIALTAAPLRTSHISAYWVTKNFGKWIRSFNFVPSKREEVGVSIYDESKKDFLKWMGKVDILIDDNVDNIKEAQSVGVQGILISRPWNKDGFSDEEIVKSL